jgi:AcrR family transcriptional regulator
MATQPTTSPWRGEKRKRNAQYDEKLAALLDAAATAFRERGYDGTSLSDLAGILGITKPTVYYYVKSKDHLLLQIKLRAQDEILAFLRLTEAGPGSAAQKLEAIMIKYALVMSSDYGACMTMIRARTMAPSSREEIERREEQAGEIIYRVLDAGATDGSLDIRDRTVAFHALFGSLNWISAWYNEAGRLPPQSMAKLHVETLLNGVAPRR